MDTPTAALSDLDGTLVDSESRTRARWSAFLDQHGIDHDERLLDRFIGRRRKDAFAEHPELFAGSAPAQVEDRMRVRAPAVPPPPVLSSAESVSFLHALHAQGGPLALVASSGRAWAEEAVSDLGVMGRFRGLVTAEDVALGKPAPEDRLRGAEMPGRRPQHTVVFEDSPAGVSAAERAGAVCVAVTTTHTPAAPAAADRVVIRPGEVDRPHICETAGRTGGGTEGGKVR